MKMDAMRIALISQQAEHAFAGMPSGIMDQTIVAAGRAGHAMLLDCRDYSQKFIAIDPAELRVVITNSMVKHELTGGEYKQRREQCEAGAAFFQKSNSGVKALRDVTLEQIESAKSALGDLTYRRCKHVVTENARCTQFADLLTQQQYEQAGQLMLQSHVSMRDDFEITTAELDFLVEQAMSMKGVYGSRMTGGGFGGCTVTLVQPRHAEAFMAEIKRVYSGRYKLDADVFSTTATDGGERDRCENRSPP